MAKKTRSRSAGQIDADAAEELFNAVRLGMSFEECLNHDDIREALGANLQAAGSPWSVEDVLGRVFSDRRRRRGVRETMAEFAHVELSDALRHRIEEETVVFREAHDGRTIEKLLIGQPTRDAFTAVLRSIGVTDRELPTARRVAQNLFKNPERLKAVRESVSAAPPRNPPAPPEPTLEEIEARLFALAGDDADAVADVRHVLRLLKARDGQAAFREQVLAAYGGACAISGCTILPALQAAHIEPFNGPASHRPGNGIPLRSDLHALFDANLLGIDPGTGAIHLHPDVTNTGHYVGVEGVIIRSPSHAAATPESVPLRERWELFSQRCRGAL